MKIASLEIDLLANIARLQRDMDKANTVVGRSMQNIERHVQRVQRAFGALGLGLSIGVMLRQAQQLADAWQGMENRLRLVTNNSTQLSRSLDDVYRIAQRTSAGLDATSQVYQRFAQNAGALGISMGQVASLSETVSKAVAISGASAQAADAALMQFGQALASGVLRGEEFNSIMEQTPGLMQALADGMGVPLGQMRALAQQGKITGDVIVAALANAAGAVDERFNTRIMTVSQSWTMLNNALTRYVGEMSGATGASSGVAEMIAKISRAIDSARGGLADFNRELDGFRVFGELVVDAWEAVDEFGQNFQRMLGVSDGEVRSLGDSMLRSFTQSFLDTAKELDGLYGAFTGTVASLWSIFETLGHNIKTLFSNTFNDVLKTVSGVIADLSEAANALPGVNISYTRFDPGNPEKYKSITDEAKKAFDEGQKALGAYDALARRIGDAGIWRAAEEAMSAYTDEVEGAGRATGTLGSATDGTKKKISDAAKAAQQFEQQRRAYLRSQYEEISNLSDQADALEDQVRYYGLSESALNDLTIARLREQQAAFDGITGAEEQIEILQRMIDQYERLGLNMRKLEQKEAEKAAWESWSRDVEQIFQQVGQSLTDAIFEGGKSGRELVKDLFKTLTLRVLINPVMNSIQGAVTNSLGGMFGLQNPQQGGVMGTVSNLGSAYNAASGGLTGNISNVANWVGEKLGSSALQSFASGLSGTAWTASTPMFALSSALPATATWAGTAAGLAGTAAAVPSLAGVAAGPGLAASLGTSVGTAGAAASAGAAGIGTAIGAALPWIGGALAIGSLLGGDLFGGGPPRTRQGQRTTAELMDGRYGIASTDDRMPAGTDAAVLTMAQAGVDMANELFRRVGVDAAIDSFYAIAESSVLGDRQGVASGGMLRTGDQMRQIGIPQASDMTFAGFGGWSEADMLSRLQTDIQLSILEAFQAQIDSLPAVLGDMIRGVDVRALDAAGAQELAARFSAVVEGASNFLAIVETMPFEHLRDLSFDAAAGLVQLAGGVESLMGIEQDYYQNFYTEAERQQHAIDNIAKSLSGVGVEMPAITGSTEQMLAAFRALRESQDLNTEAGRAAYVVLGQVSGAFADVARSAEQAAQEQRRIAAERRQSVLDDLTGAYNNLVSVGQAEIARLRQSFGTTDSAMERYRSAVQALESEFGALFSSIDRYVSDLRGSVEASAQAQYRQARAVISTALATGQLPQTADLTEALQVAQRGVTSQVYGSLFEQNRAYAILANEMEALKGIAEPELDAAKATLAQLEEQYALLRGTNRIEGDSLSALEQQVRLAFATEEAARSQISLIEQQLETAKQQYEELMGINSAITDLAAAIREFAAAAAAAKTVVSGGGGGGGTGGWTPDNLPSGAESLSAAERYVLYNNDLLQEQARSGMSVEQYAQFHWNTYGQYEDRDIRYRAAGGYTPPGLTWVGEEGPELVNFKQPGMVYTAAQSANLAGGGSGEVVGELRALREQNARLERRLASIEQATGQLADQFDNVTAGGNAMATEEMA